MKKRILSTALALVMCLSLLPSTALAVNEPQFRWFEGVEPYDSYTNAEEGLIVVRTKDAECALFNMEAEVLVNFGTYDSIGVLTGGTLDSLIPENYSISDIGDGLLPVAKGGKWGFIDTTGKLVIPCGYDSAKDFSEGLARVEKDGKWGLINTSGKVVLPIEYDYFVGDFSEGLAWVQKDGKYGFIDEVGKLVIPCVYDQGAYFSEGLARVKKDGKYGYINTTGNPVVPCEYDDVGDFSEGLARVGVGEYGYDEYGGDTFVGKWGFVDTTGELVISCEYDDARSFSEGLAGVEKDGKWGFIDTTGELVIPCVYDHAYYAYDFSGGLAQVAVGEYPDQKYGLIDTSGEVVLPIEYGFVGNFSEGLARVFKDEKYGYINTRGELVISCEYDYAEDFSEGLARVAVGEYPDRKYGLINTRGETVLPIEYDYVTEFYGGLALVEKEGKCGFINTSGNLVIDCKYEDVLNYDYTWFYDEYDEYGPEYYDFSLARVVEEGLVGLIDRDGKPVIPCEYKNIGYDGGLAVTTNASGKLGFFNKDGEMLLSHSYDLLGFLFNVGISDNLMLWVGKDGNFGIASEPLSEYLTLPEYGDHTVTFDSKGGSKVKTQSVDDDQKLTKPTDPTKSGFDFGGWYRDTVFEKVEDTVYTLEVDTENLFNDVYKWNFDTDVVYGDFTLHAKWTASQNDNDDNQNNDQNNNTNTDNGGGNGGYTGPVNIPGKKPEQPKPEQPKDEEKPVQTVTFTDVPSGAYYADAVAWAVEKGITNGVGGGSFAPEASCT
ncbi:MAG: WG repeat-containing protein, partial [Oscillospiraceae bacterium]|nr:WG repeat-containing protein [Oscillospiraceae bacterium]